MAKVFISYRREKSEQVDTLVEDIDDLGHDVWIDRHHEGNQQWWNTILSNIAERDAFIPVYDINYDDSYPCCRELDYAVALQRQIIPVFVDDDLPEDFAPRHSREFNYVQYSFDRLSIKNIQKRLSRVVEIPNGSRSLDLKPSFPAPELSEIFKQHVVKRPGQSTDEQILSLDRIEGLIGNNFPKSEVIFLLEEHKRRGPLGEYEQLRPNDNYSRIKKRLNYRSEAINSQIPPSGTSIREADSTTTASKDASESYSHISSTKTANQNENSQTQFEPGKKNKRKTSFLPLLGGFAIGAMIGGVVSPIFFNDTTDLQNQNDKLSKEISTLIASNQDELKQLQNTHDVEIDGIEKQLEEQKNLVSDASSAVSDANAVVSSKESEIAKLKEQLAELKMQGQSTPSKEPTKNAYSDIMPRLQMVPIPSGTFRMGSPENEVGRLANEGPQHEVAIRAFELSDTEVSFEQYDIFASETKRELPDDEGWGRGSLPVINVSWSDANAYIDWLNEKTSGNFRLPSEAELEYAARAGTTTPFYMGNCINTKQANYDGNSSDYNNCGAYTGESLGSTSAIKTYETNDWDLYDMSGNVYVWTQDCWHSDYTDAPIDGSSWLEDNGGECDRRMLRGGSWDDEPVDLRSAFRIGVDRDGTFYNVGFRVARTP